MKKRLFGRHQGREVEQVVLQSADAEVAILSYGCALRDWRVQGPGRSLPMVLGFTSLEDYALDTWSLGVICGRVANRIAQARFPLEGRVVQVTRNHGPHHLHGGAVGLGRRVWEMDVDAATDAVHLHYLSPEGEEGYPGTVEFAVTYRLEGSQLVCEMAARPDRPTPINLAHHAYYNLAAEGDVRDHQLWIAAKDYTPLGPDQIPLGTIEPVAGTRMDFSEPRTLADSDPGRQGHDGNLVLDPARNRAEPSAWAISPRSGLRLRLWTDEPGLQLFDAPALEIAAPGLDGQHYGPFSGLCLEAQHFPDSVNHPDWPSTMRTPEAPYFQRLVVDISPAS